MDERLVLIGSRIESERRRLGWLTQEMSADMCGVTRPTWGKYERGDSEINPQALKRFIEHGADYDFIFTGVRKGAVDESAIKTGSPSYLSLPATISLRDRQEQEVVEAMRIDSRVGNFLWKLACVLKMADFDALESSGNLVCRSIIEKRGLVLAKIEEPSVSNEREAAFIRAYRLSNSKLQGLVRAACDVEDAQVTDTDMTYDGYSGIECRLIRRFRESTENGKKIIDEILLSCRVDTAQNAA